MINGSIVMAERARAVRKKWTPIIIKHFNRGHTVEAIHRKTGKSQDFIRRVIREYENIQTDTAPQNKQPKQTDSNVTVFVMPDGRGNHTIRISLPRPPWGEIKPDPRQDTAPRGKNYMVSRPVTRVERIERELWKAGVA